MNRSGLSVLAVFAAFGIVASLTGACGSSSPEHDTMSVSKTCLETTCDQRNKASSNACVACLDACSAASYDCDSTSACQSSCGDNVSCTDDDRTHCEETGFKAQLPENLDGDLEAACNRLRAQVSACGQTPLGPEACTLFAKTERAERAATYDCYAKLACGADSTACDPQPTTLGDELCAATAKCDALCNADDVKVLDMEGGWLRDDVQKAARDCLAFPSCSDRSDCFAAWYAASIE